MIFLDYEFYSGTGSMPVKKTTCGGKKGIQQSEFRNGSFDGTVNITLYRGYFGTV